MVVVLLDAPRTVDIVVGHLLWAGWGSCVDSRSHDEHLGGGGGKGDDVVPGLLPPG